MLSSPRRTSLWRRRSSATRRPNVRGSRPRRSRVSRHLISSADAPRTPYGHQCLHRRSGNSGRDIYNLQQPLLTYAGVWLAPQKGPLGKRNSTVSFRGQFLVAFDTATREWKRTSSSTPTAVGRHRSGPRVRMRPTRPDHVPTRSLVRSHSATAARSTCGPAIATVRSSRSAFPARLTRWRGPLCRARNRRIDRSHEQATIGDAAILDGSLGRWIVEGTTATRMIDACRRSRSLNTYSIK